MVMLDVVDLGLLMTYAHRNARYTAEYGTTCWALVYQTDCRARSELMLRLHADMVTQHQQRLANGAPTVFDPSRPWNSVWAAMLES